MQKIQTYLSNCNRLLQTGNAREHSYRGDLQELLNQIINDENIIVTNEPARIRDVGAPDYSITKKDIPIGYIEAKDIDKPLGSKEYKEQFDRYKNALDNLIITDYLDFWFYKNGELVQKIQIGKIKDGSIIAIEDNFNTFINSIKDFTSFVSQTITSPSKLAKLMAGKARLLEDVIQKAIESDEENEANNSLRNQLEVFKANLIHDITPQSFADIYAQTIAYGLFAARLHDKTLETFSRQEAVYLIPKSNPFLRGLFNYISGVECDDRLIWIIDSLAEIFLATNIAKLLEGFNQKTGMNDPIIHFYETFLGEYNPKLRKARGVWYTPEAVVNFIVRACDEVLKDEFALEDGLSDETKIKIKVDDLEAGFTKSGTQRQKEIETHKVQILDPATGTGTFLAETIKFIKKDFWGGSWSSYVEEHLVPRLNGFELLMASYAMAHLKLDLLLLETGYIPSEKQKRFNVFLTNSLEEHHEQAGSLFSSYLANESKEADRVKKETPVMVVMGNPPYSGVSSNNIEWISKKIDDYKYIDGVHFNERKHWLNDDYVKFIRYAEYLINKNEEGILAFINPHGFLDNTTFRGMRYHLLNSFDKIYTIDLHGNSNKKEVCPDGSKDENVFDIKQGVSINIFVKKKSKSKKLADVFHYDLYGRRDFKYQFLTTNSLKDIEWTKVEVSTPNYFLIPKNNNLLGIYNKSFAIDNMFPINVTGMVTARDAIVIDFDKNILKERIESFCNTKYSDAEIRNRLFPNKKDGKYKAGDSRGWNLDIARTKIKDNNHADVIEKFDYRPFDTRSIYYTKDMVDWGREKVMKHFILGNNLGLVFSRQSTNENWNNIQLTDKMIDNRYHFSAKGTALEVPLYLYPDENSLETQRTPNLNLEIVKEIEEKLNLKFTNKKIQNSKLNIQNSTTFAPIDILDYIYAVLHSPAYRETYKEFLKIDFPRVPYPEPKTFWKLVELGGRLRVLHLLEDKSLDDRIIDIKGEGTLEITNKLNKKDFIEEENGTITLNLNSEIAIINIPKISWEFYIGGYQPAQKWLKDRAGRTLSRADLKHYNKIINALMKTDEVMREIDEVFEV
jgi:predicted helicase